VLRERGECVNEADSVLVELAHTDDTAAADADTGLANLADSVQPAYVSIRQHSSAYVSIRQHTSA
jgi:hypothetical protein